MNKKTIKKLRLMAAEAITHYKPKFSQPQEERQWLLRGNDVVLKAIKKYWYALPTPEREKFTQSKANEIAYPLLFPKQIKKPEKASKPKPRTKNKAKTKARSLEKLRSLLPGRLEDEAAA